MSVKTRALDLLDAGCWSREATVSIIKELLEELNSSHKALNQIIDRGTDYDVTINELVYIAKEALK